MKVAVIGLGSMGYGMARSILGAGHDVVGSDVDPSAVDRFRTDGGSHESLAAAVERLDALVLAVLNAAQVDEVLFGQDGLAERMPVGAVVIMCVTVAPDHARRTAARCADAGLLFLDAPMSGGSAKAAQGQLSIMASGSAEAFSRSRPVLDAMAQMVFELGDVAGAGSAMKAVNQMLAGIHIAAMAEALTFGMTQGVDPAKFLEIIPRCAGTSWMLENRAPHVVNGDYTARSAVDIWPKDLGIVLDAARAAGFSAPVTAAVLHRFETASEMGFGREDDAAVAKVYADQAGLTLPDQMIGALEDLSRFDDGTISRADAARFVFDQARDGG